jgi:hypothetical protein
VTSVTISCCHFGTATEPRSTVGPGLIVFGELVRLSSRPRLVDSCKLTNETRLAIEDGTANSGQAWLAVLNGTVSGGGYELALACGHILWSTTGRRWCRCPNCRCWECCPAPAA